MVVVVDGSVLSALLLGNCSVRRWLRGQRLGQQGLGPQIHWNHLLETVLAQGPWQAAAWVP